MTVTATERFESRRLTDNQSHERVYTIQGTSDEATALTTLKATAPATANSLTRGDCQLEPLYIDTGNEADCLWIGTAPYSNTGSASASSLDIGDIIIQGTTTGGQQHLTFSASTVTSYRAGGGDAPDCHGAIGVNGDQVEGVDVGVRQFEFTVTKVFASGSYPTLANLYALSWTTNNAQVTFTDSKTGLTITLAIGEGLCMGVDFGRARGDGGLEFTYHFGASPNRVAMPVGDTITIDKKGWEYLWVLFETADSEGKIIKTPIAAYVEKVYEAGTWSGLGI